MVEERQDKNSRLVLGDPPWYYYFELEENGSVRRDMSKRETPALTLTEPRHAGRCGPILVSAPCMC